MRKFVIDTLKVLRRNIIAILLFVLIAVIFTQGLSSIAGGNNEEAKKLAEDSLRRAVVTCYAVEGKYPDSYEYLKENYNLNIDEEKYIVHYLPIGANLMPDIAIFEVS